MAYQDPYATSLGWGPGTPQATTSLGVPLQNNGMNLQLDQVSPFVRELEAQRANTVSPYQNNQQLQYGSFGGANMNGYNPAPAPSSAAFGAPPSAQPSFGPGNTGNPYLQPQIDQLTKGMSDNFTQRIAPGMRFAAMGSGNTGSSRQGILERFGMQDLNNSIGNSITNLQSGNWQADQNRASNDFNTNRSLDLQQQQVGANLFNQGVQGAAGLGSGVYGLGTQQQQAPWNIMNQASGVYNPWSGLGTTNSQQSGGGIGGIIGGLLGGGNFARQMGWM